MACSFQHLLFKIIINSIHSIMLSFLQSVLEEIALTIKIPKNHHINHSFFGTLAEFQSPSYGIVGIHFYHWLSDIYQLCAFPFVINRNGIFSECEQRCVSLNKATFTLPQNQIFLWTSCFEFSIFTSK